MYNAHIWNHSVVSDSDSMDLWQAPLSMRFSRQEYWSGLPFSFSRGSSRPRDRTCVSCIAGRFFTVWATRETLYMESRKMILMNLVAGQRWQCRHRDQTYGHRQGPGGREERVGWMERVAWKHIHTICKIDSQWGFAVWLRELKLGLCNSLERWEGVGGGKEV